MAAAEMLLALVHAAQVENLIESLTDCSQVADVDDSEQAIAKTEELTIRSSCRTMRDCHCCYSMAM